MNRYRWLLRMLAIVGALLFAGLGVFLYYSLTHKVTELAAVVADSSTALATVFLAVVTVLAILLPVTQREEEQRESTIAALHQLLVTIALMKRRVQLLVADPSWKADSLLNGMDSAFALTLSERSLPRTARTEIALIAIFQAQETLAYATYLQNNEHADEMELRLHAGLAQKRLRAAYDETEKALIELDGLALDTPLPEDVSELFGDFPRPA